MTGPLPICNACGVEYTEGYEGPCQEPRGSYTPHVGWNAVCPGLVSWRATAEKLHAELTRLPSSCRRAAELSHAS